MKLTDGRSDAIELVQDIKHQMATLRDLLGELEYLVYRCDDRVEIDFFERGEHDKGRSQKRTKAD